LKNITAKATSPDKDTVIIKTEMCLEAPLLGGNTVIRMGEKKFGTV
jgi:hypothetical protein